MKQLPLDRVQCRRSLSRRQCLEVFSDGSGEFDFVSHRGSLSGFWYTGPLSQTAPNACSLIRVHH